MASTEVRFSATWTRTADELPPERVEVETKVSDEKGERNVQTMRLYRGLWWIPNAAGTDDYYMYVYYSPTHWRMS